MEKTKDQTLRNVNVNINREKEGEGKPKDELLSAVPISKSKMKGIGYWVRYIEKSYVFNVDELKRCQVSYKRTITKLKSHKLFSRIPLASCKPQNKYHFNFLHEVAYF